MNEITEKTREEIAELYLKPLVDDIRVATLEQIRENFCLLRCERLPEKELCPEAKAIYGYFVNFVLRKHSELN